MIFVIDNFDSFTYNIVQYLQEMRYEVLIKRNNKTSIKEIAGLKPSHIIISPGPGDPDKAGISIEVINYFKGKIPILGVCLGHQCIGQAFGGKIRRSKKLYHGKTSLVDHDSKGVYTNLPTPLTQTRYHSLVLDRESLPKELLITSTSEDGEIMGIRHREYSIEGVQFHPESIASQKGYQILHNFIKPKSPKTNVQDSLKKIWAGHHLLQPEAEAMMKDIADGEISPTMTAALLTALSMKGESVDEVAGFAKIMRERSTFIQTPNNQIVVDTCGTGGDRSGTFNISTVTSMVVAGAGVCVAKHGNRSITSKCGSADLFEHLGVNLNVPVSTMERALRESGLAFLFAQKLHTAMKQVIGVRKELGIRTLFNILGPLSNPARTKHQIIGVFDKNLTKLMAKVMARLGIERGLVVHGSDGLDEITLTGETFISELNQGDIKHYTISPEQFGLNRCDKDELIGGDVEKNSHICHSILAGFKGGPRNIVVLNAGAVLYIAGKVASIKDGIELAKNSIDSGAAQKKLETLISITNSQ